VCTKGKKVLHSESVLLQKLNLKPFEYGMEVKFVYDDGSLLTPEVFKMSPDDILAKFRKGANNLAALSLAVGDVNELSVPHMILNGFKNLAAISLETGAKLPQLGAMSTAAPSKPAQAPAKDDKKAPEPKKEEKKEEQEEVALGDMFGD
jgi:large subunit ribosomal protein LP0